MPDTTPDSDRILRDAKRSLVTQQHGGTHRPAPRGSIGKGSANLKQKSLLKRVRNIVLAVVAIWMGAGIAGVGRRNPGEWGRGAAADMGWCRGVLGSKAYHRRGAADRVRARIGAGLTFFAACRL